MEHQIILFLLPPKNVHFKIKPMMLKTSPACSKCRWKIALDRYNGNKRKNIVFPHTKIIFPGEYGLFCPCLSIAG